MTNKGRFVFDTSILVRAALISASTAGQAFRKARQLGEILSSVPTAEELNEVLNRDKFSRYITSEERERFLAAFLRVAVVVEISEAIAACRDPKDDKFLELAVSGHATCVVSGDNDLLALNPFRRIPILSAEQFLESF
jgi:putative PIN family toxin of toxin-antitoxin system